MHHLIHNYEYIAFIKSLFWNSKYCL